MIQGYFHRFFLFGFIGVFGLGIVIMHLYSFGILLGLEQYSELLLTLQSHGDLFLSRVVFNLFDLNSVLVITPTVVIQAIIKVIQSWTWFEMGLFLWIPYLVYQYLLGALETKKVTYTYLMTIIGLLGFQLIGVALTGLFLALFYGSPALLINNIRILLVVLSLIETSIVGGLVFRWLKLGQIG